MGLPPPRDAWSTKLWLLVIEILSVAICIQADLPVHCLNVHVAGRWTLHLTPTQRVSATSHSPQSAQRCGNPVPDSSLYHLRQQPDSLATKVQLVVDLKEPNLLVVVQGTTLSGAGAAAIPNGTSGHWTMVYDEAMELTVAHYRFLAFFDYTPRHAHVTTHDLDARDFHSLCDRTVTGWLHEDLPLPAIWGCFQAVKEGAQPVGAHEFHLDRNEEGDDDDDDDDDEEHSGHQKTHGQDEKEDADDDEDAFLLERVEAIPAAFDWRNHSGRNYISPVRNQLAFPGDCGSCYAFAAIDAAEARIRILSNLKQQPLLSVQAAVSCSMYNQGCEGGYPFLAAKHGRDFGFVDERCMPYVGRDVPCKILGNRSADVCSRAYVVSHYSYVGGYYGAASVPEMQRAIMDYGPIMITFMIPDGLQTYKGGVFVAPPGGSHIKTEGPTLFGHKGNHRYIMLRPWERTSHAVTCVGWGIDSTHSPAMPYWIMKGNLGPDWGEGGFFRIRRGTDECGVESMPVVLDMKLNA